MASGGVVLDSRHTFSAHIQSAINEARCGIGMLRFLSNYLPIQTPNELYELYILPHLDYGDVFYHNPQKVNVNVSVICSTVVVVCYCCHVLLLLL